MSEEAKKVVTEQPKDDKSKEKPDAKPDAKDDSKKDDSKGQNINKEYETKLEKYKKPDPEKAKEAFKERKEKREDPDNLPITRKEFKEALRKTEDKTIKSVTKGQAEGLVKSLTTSDTEKELVMNVYDNTIFPSHYTMEDKVKASVAMANSDKLIGERNELARALKSKDKVGKDAVDTKHDQPESGAAPKQAADMKAVLASQGFEYDKETKMFSKPLGGGYTMIHDPKTGKNRRVKSQ